MTRHQLAAHRAMLDHHFMVLPNLPLNVPAEMKELYHLALIAWRACVEELEESFPNDE